MGRPPLSVSVIVPTRDTRALTLRCLASLAASERPAAEIVVVDDGSGDGTSEAVRAAWPSVRLLRHEAPAGFTASVNAAWPLAASEIVLLLNSDTEVDPRALQGFAEAFAQDARLGIAGATLRYADGCPQWSAGPEPSAAWLFALASGGATALAALPGWQAVRTRARRASAAAGDVAWLPATAMAVRREVRAAIGLFDPALRTYAQDLDYCFRARAAGWRVAQLSDVGVVHHLGGTIGASDDAVASRQDPRALFTDLARWIHKAHPPARARRDCRALLLGARTRLAGRHVRRWFTAPADRAAWDRDTARYRAALDALEEIAR